MDFLHRLKEHSQIVNRDENDQPKDSYSSNVVRTTTGRKPAPTISSKKPANKVHHLRATNEKKKHKLQLGEQRLIFRIVFFVVLVFLFCLARYFVINSASREGMFLCEAVKTQIVVYVSLLAFNAGSLDLVFFDNQDSRLESKSAFAFLKDWKKIYTGQALTSYRDSLSKDAGDSSKLLRKLDRATACDALRETEEKEAPTILGCETAIGGIANKSVGSFLSQYVNICDQLIQDWQLLPTYEQRVHLLKTDPYNSLFAYSVVNSFGSADAIFFHFMNQLMPVLMLKLDSLPGTLNLTNIISIIVSPLLVAVLCLFILLQFNKYQWSFWRIIYLVPVALIEETPLLKQRMKNAQVHGNYAYY